MRLYSIDLLREHLVVNTSACLIELECHRGRCWFQLPHLLIASHAIAEIGINTMTTPANTFHAVFIVLSEFHWSIILSVGQLVENLANKNLDWKGGPIVGLYFVFLGVCKLATTRKRPLSMSTGNQGFFSFYMSVKNDTLDLDMSKNQRSIWTRIRVGRYPGNLGIRIAFVL